jgi:uncharacterized protein YecE (DUF72 family)
VPAGAAAAEPELGRRGGGGLPGAAARAARGPVALEPRHPTWFAEEPEAQLVRHDVARVAADPARVPEAALPGGARSLEYHRLHGSPRIYYTPYDDAYLDALAPRLRAAARRGAAVWCVFDNTASGAALPNALALRTRLRGRA